MLSRPVPSKWRRLWPLKTGSVFLNHGSFGACPKAILQLQSALRLQMEAEPVQFLWRRYEERLEPARAELARFVGARSQDVVFVTNATTGVNAVVRSLKLRRGDELLTTNLDYNACHNVMVAAAQMAGAKLKVAEVPFPIRSEDEAVEAILAEVTPRTRLAMIDHVTSNTAVVLPLARIIKELECRCVETLVDGAHAPGMLSLNLSRLRPLAYTGNLHKWVCAPKGTAFLWVRPDKQGSVQPAVISHGNNTPRPGYNDFQDRFDWAGTFDPTAWLCVGEAIRWMERLLPGGWAQLRERNHALAVDARNVICQKLGVEPPCPERLLGSIATMPLPAKFPSQPRNGKLDSEQVHLYDKFGIEVPFCRIGTPARRYFRISAQIYNTIGEYEYLAAALKSFTHSRS